MQYHHDRVYVTEEGEKIREAALDVRRDALKP